MTQYSKPTNYGSQSGFKYRAWARANPTEYQEFRRLYKENKARLEQHYQQNCPMDLEERIVRGYN